MEFILQWKFTTTSKNKRTAEELTWSGNSCTNRNYVINNITRQNQE